MPFRHQDAESLLLSLLPPATEENPNPHGAVDLIFADPPFNISQKYVSYRDDISPLEYKEFTRNWVRAAERALRPGASLWINCPDQHASFIDHYCAETLMLTRRRWCIWHYRFGHCTRDNFISSHTHLLYYVKPGAAFTWNPTAVLVPSDRASTYKDPRTLDSPTPGLRVPLDVWYGEHFSRIQGNNPERVPEVPNQLPERLLDRIILSCSNPGNLVVDPFCGSGTTAVVAHVRSRRFLTSDTCKETLVLAVKRFSQGATHL